MKRLIVVAFVVIATTLSAWGILSGFRLNPDVAGLLPSEGSSAVLTRYLKGFGGGGLGAVLVEAEPEEAERVADEIAARFAADPRVEFAAARLEFGSTSGDPLLAWRFADERGRAALAEALTDEGMRERLGESKKLLLIPGNGAMVERLSKDPLRLADVPLQARVLGSGVRTRSDGAFASDDGGAHLVIVKPKGFALKGEDARAFTALVEEVLSEVRREHPSATISATGPHLIAAEMETMLRRDLQLSGIVSTVMASLAFLLVFRRFRALLAILPPLLLGTLWTTGFASAFPQGLSAIAVAFVSIVVGVGFDSGVHVYAAFLSARREGSSPRDAARIARSETLRPVMTAALIAGAAFGCLLLSDIPALRELGMLCAVGEVLTAVAIVLITPEIASLIERGDPGKEAPPAHARWIEALTATRTRAWLALALALGVTLTALLQGVTISDSLVAIRPKNVKALEAEDRIFEVFGGREKPWIVLVEGASRDEAMTRADALAERLARDPEIVESVDALTSVVPSAETQAARLRERDALDLPKKADALERALKDTGFAPARFASVLEAMRNPPSGVVSVDELLEGSRAVLGSRYLAFDGADLAVLHVHTKPGVAPERFEQLVAAGPEGGLVTGYAKLEVDLRGTLSTELPRIGAVAGVLVLALLAVSLRSVKEVVLSALVLVVGLGVLFGVISAFGVPLHIYSALVIPVLLGISVDEAMFLLHHARGGGDDAIRRTLERETRPVITTALTTSAGLVALCFAHYDGLRHLGIVGAVGNFAILVTALLLVPAGLRLLTTRALR